MWVRPVADSAVVPLLYVGNGGTDGFGVIVHNGDGGVGENFFSLDLPGLTWSATGTSGSLPRDRWTHIAITRGEYEWKMYRNGALIGRSVAEPNAPPTEFLRIGPDFEGYIDEVRIWERHRTQEEIRQSLYRPLEGTEEGLALYYDMNEAPGMLARNRASRTGALLNGALWGSAEFVPNDLPFFSGALPDVRLSSFPSYMQLVPRGKDGFGSIKAVGEIVTPGFDSIAVEVTREGAPYAYTSAPLSYTGSGASFAFSTPIRAELAEYNQQLVAIRGRERFVVAEAADLVAGDAYLIVGQSNAHSTDVTVTTNNRFVRSFGIQTTNVNYDRYNVADTMWGRANSHGFGGFASGPLLTGVWGQRLQEMIAENQGIPVCIINGAAGGSLIIDNVPGPLRIDDVSIYGKMLYRVERAGLREHIRAIFWAHGESQTIEDQYAESFRKMYTAWHEDYTGLEKVYVMQIRPGCILGKQHGALREFQRTLPDSFPDVVVMSTVGLNGHDGCHYTAEGYREMGEKLYGLVARDLYGTTDVEAVAPPDLRRAFFTDNSNQEIALVFEGKNHGIVWPADTVVEGGPRSMIEGFFLDGTGGHVSSGRVSGDTVYLTLNAPSTATTISYLPDLPWYENTHVLYQGPWLRNSRGLGVLSFHEQPIGTAVEVSAVESNEPVKIGSVQIVPNPVSSYAKVRFDLGASRRGDITILDMQGVVRLEKQVIGSGEISIDLSALPAGRYLCRVGEEKTIFSIVR